MKSCELFLCSWEQTVIHVPSIKQAFSVSPSQRQCDVKPFLKSFDFPEYLSVTCQWVLFLYLSCASRPTPGLNAVLPEPVLLQLLEVPETGLLHELQTRPQSVLLPL